MFGRNRLGVKVDDDRRAFEVRQLDRASVLVGEFEVGGCIAGFDHLASIPPTPSGSVLLRRRVGGSRDILVHRKLGDVGLDRHARGGDRRSDSLRAEGIEVSAGLP
jgi:hypothetical protein